MPFPPCKRCSGYVVVGEDGRETRCLMCGRHQYNVPTLDRAALDREERERREKYYARGNGRRRLVPPSTPRHLASPYGAPGAV